MHAEICHVEVVLLYLLTCSKSVWLMHSGATSLPMPASDAFCIGNDVHCPQACGPAAEAPCYHTHVPVTIPMYLFCQHSIAVKCAQQSVDLSRYHCPAPPALPPEAHNPPSSPPSPRPMPYSAKHSWPWTAMLWCL